jgi:hypothetical protein
MALETTTVSVLAMMMTTKAVVLEQMMLGAKYRSKRLSVGIGAVRRISHE